MRSLFPHATSVLVLAAALLNPGLLWADPAPPLMLAQQHHVEKDGKKGVVFHVTTDVSDLQGKPCVVIVHILDRNGNPIEALSKEYSNSRGNAAVRESLTSRADDRGVTVELFMPYDAIAAQPDAQDLRVASDVWNSDEGRYVLPRPYQADLQFDPMANAEAIESANAQFERERDHIRRHWHRHHHHHPRHWRWR
jgi:hypothetical protein